MRSLLRFSLLAFALAAGCGQKGPLVLKPPPARTPVATTAAPVTPTAPSALAMPATAAPAASETKDPSDDKPPAPRG